MWDDEDRTGRWKAEISGSQDNQGMSQVDFNAKVEQKPSDSVTWSAGIGTGIRQDRDGDVKANVHGFLSLEGEF